MTSDPNTEDDTGETDGPPRSQREAVRQRYAAIVDEGDAAGGDDTTAGGAGRYDDGTEPDDTATGGCCGESAPGDTACCTDDATGAHGRTLGYSDEDLASVPDGATLGLGCGNPTAIADLAPGETVLDLGSGGGFDCFLAARAVGEDGHVIGVDMTPEMVERARANAERHGHDAVEFRLGEIEHLPVPDGRVDVVISNCVLNLSPDKAQVLEEAHRVLKPDGRLAISDVVATPEGREALEGADPEGVAGCIAGAATADRLRELLESAGFESVSVRPTAESDGIVREMYGRGDVADALYSGVIEGVKPSE